MGYSQTYCCICGGPFEDRGQRDEQPWAEWLAHPVVMTTGYYTDSGIDLDAYLWHMKSDSYALDRHPYLAESAQRHVLRLNARYKEHNHFEILESGEVVNAFIADGPMRQGQPFYLAIHSLCNKLAEKFINSRTTTNDIFQIGPEDEISSIKQLWEVLHRRMRGYGPGNSEYILPSPFDYFGGRYCRNVYWERDDNPEYGKMLEADPIIIPGLTETILQNLQPQNCRESPMEQEKAKLSFQDMTQSSDIEGNQDQWCDILLEGKALPWLWDLDSRAVDKKRREGNWNWELLVHQLSKVTIYEPTGTTLNLPLGLRNRRRIWRNLEEARFDDIAKDMIPSKLMEKRRKRLELEEIRGI